MMSKRAQARGNSLPDVLREVLAEISDADEEQVNLTIEIDDFDLDDLQDIRVTVTYVIDSDEDEDADETDDEGDDQGETEEYEESNDDDDDEETQQGVSIDELDEEADAAADFLEGLLDAMQLPGDIQIRVHEDHAEVEVLNIGSGQLIGRRGQTLDSVQELLRCAIQRQFERRCRVVIDVEGYRQRRLEKLLDKAESAIEDALETGEEQRLEPMDVYERKAVHRLVAENEGVTSASRGREPTRRVVITAE
jgi:spoIIIJ-associated protein